MYGLGAKYEDRDLALPKHREDLLHAIERDLLGDENILGLFYGGSIGNKNTDFVLNILKKDVSKSLSTLKVLEF